MTLTAPPPEEDELLIESLRRTDIGRRVFVRKEARTCLNHRISCVLLFFASVSTPTLKSSHKTMTLGPCLADSF
jgi:hypothetical protein